MERLFQPLVLSGVLLGPSGALLPGPLVQEQLETRAINRLYLHPAKRMFAAHPASSDRRAVVCAPSQLHLSIRSTQRVVPLGQGAFLSYRALTQVTVRQWMPHRAKRPVRFLAMQEILNEKDGSQLVLVPSGPALIGSNVAWGSAWTCRPPCRMDVHSFYIAKYAVTKLQFKRFIQDTGYKTTAEREGSEGGAPPTCIGRTVPPRMVRMRLWCALPMPMPTNTVMGLDCGWQQKSNGRKAARGEDGSYTPGATRTRDGYCR